jgi:protein-disulfide isomerase
MHESVSELSSRVGEQKLRVRFVNFPLDTACNCHVRVCLHKTACMAARASICAQGQGKFWEYAELAFANRNSHGREDVVRFAGDLGMDAVRFERCLDSAETAAALAEDIEIAASAGVTATPTTLVNGVKYEGALSFQDLMGILEHTAMCSCDLEVKGQPSCKM